MCLISVGSGSRPTARRYRHPAAAAAGGAGPFPSAYQQPAYTIPGNGLNNPFGAGVVRAGAGAGGVRAGAAGGGAPTGDGATTGSATPICGVAPAAGGGGWGGWWLYGTITNQGTQVPPLNQQAQQVQQQVHQEVQLAWQQQQQQQQQQWHLQV